MSRRGSAIQIVLFSQEQRMVMGGGAPPLSSSSLTALQSNTQDVILALPRPDELLNPWEPQFVHL